MKIKLSTKIKRFIKYNQQDIILVIAVFLITIISFNVGRIYTTANLSNTIEVIQNKESEGAKTQSFQEENQENLSIKEFRVVTSKNSTKYHYSWCPSAKRIKPENQVWFNSAEEAEKAGYVLAKNCRL